MKNNYLDKAAVLEFLENAVEGNKNPILEDYYEDLLNDVSELIQEIKDGAYDA